MPLGIILSQEIVPCNADWLETSLPPPPYSFSKNLKSEHFCRIKNIFCQDETICAFFSRRELKLSSKTCLFTARHICRKSGSRMIGIPISTILLLQQFGAEHIVPQWILCALLNLHIILLYEILILFTKNSLVGCLQDVFQPPRFREWISISKTLLRLYAYIRVSIRCFYSVSGISWNMHCLLLYSSSSTAFTSWRYFSLRMDCV